MSYWDEWRVPCLTDLRGDISLVSETGTSDVQWPASPEAETLSPEAKAALSHVPSPPSLCMPTPSLPWIATVHASMLLLPKPCPPPPLLTPTLFLPVRFLHFLAPSSLLARRQYPSPLSRRSPFPIPFLSQNSKVPRGYGPPPPDCPRLLILPIMVDFLLYLLCPTSIRRLLLPCLLYPCFSFHSSCGVHHTFCLPTSHLLQERRRCTWFASRHSPLVRFYVRWKAGDTGRERGAAAGDADAELLVVWNNVPRLTVIGCLLFYNLESLVQMRCTFFSF